jgi:hypothetical protein
VWGSAIQKATAQGAASRGVITNRSEMGSYLGRVNLVSLVPSLILAAGLGRGLLASGRFLLTRKVDDREWTMALLTLSVLVALASYGWFLVRFPEPGKGSTIKATYLIQIFPFLAVLAGEMLERLRLRSRGGYGLAVGIWLVAALHNSGTFITRFHEQFLGGA